MVTIDTDPQKSRVEVVGWRAVRDESLGQIKNRALREGGQVLITPKGAAGLSALTESPVFDAKIQRNSDMAKIICKRLEARVFPNLIVGRFGAGGTTYR